MTTDHRTLAEERLLDAELEQVLARGRASGTTAHVPAPPRRWFAAAIILLGVAVGAGSWWLREPAPAPAQDPEPAAEPLPPPVRAEPGGLPAVPDGVVNLVCKLAGPDEIEKLGRFRRARRIAVLALDLRVKLGGTRLLGSHRGWNDAPDDLLAPLAQLPELERLRLPKELVLRPAHLRALAAARALRTLELVGERVQLTEELVAALAGLPGLRRFVLDIVPVDAAGIARLAAAGLQDLELSRCPGLDAESFAALANLRTLRALRLHGLGGPAIGEGPVRYLQAPTAAAVARLRELPELRELSFQGCVLEDGVFAALPQGLRMLQLTAVSGFAAESLRELRRLGELRELRFRAADWSNPFFHRGEKIAGEVPPVLTAVVEVLRLRALQYHGPVTGELLRAIAAQPDLARVELHAQPAPDLRPLGSATALAELQLLQTPLAPEDLRPLRACPRLRRLVLWPGGSLDPAAVRELLGGRVEVSDQPAGFGRQ